MTLKYFILFFRFIHVYRPFAARTTNMLRRAKIGMGVVCLMGLIVMAMSYIPNRAIVTKGKRTGKLYFEWVGSGLLGGNAALYNKVYGIVFEIVLKFVIPFLIIVPLIVFTIMLLIRQSREMRNLQQGALPNRKPDHTVTLTLVGIVVAFVILRGPYMLGWALLVSGTNISYSFLGTFLVVIKSLMVLNPVCNFIIYFVTGRAFRERLRNVFRRKKQQKPTESASNMSLCTIDTEM